jgi:hypothetical protein
MTDLTAALREAGHDDLAAALERKALVRGLREAGREDLADALESGEFLPAGSGAFCGGGEGAPTDNLGSFRPGSSAKLGFPLRQQALRGAPLGPP